MHTFFTPLSAVVSDYSRNSRSHFGMRVHTYARFHQQPQSHDALFPLYTTIYKLSVVIQLLHAGTKVFSGFRDQSDTFDV
jgi:hypothetical protein